MNYEFIGTILYLTGSALFVLGSIFYLIPHLK